MNLVIFLKNGETLLFQDVEDDIDHRLYTIEFTYYGHSTGEIMEGYFSKDHIAGYSLTKI